MSKNLEKKLDKKIMNSVFKRWWLGVHTGWNYEKMQGLGYSYAMMPALKEIYKDDEEGLKAAVKNNMQFFNTNATTGSLIIGATLALEEQGSSSREAVTAVKTGLMGPLAGVGDTLFTVLPNTVIGSIAAYMALEGNPIGIFLWIAFNIMRVTLIKQFIQIGYTQGTKLVGSLGGVLKNVTEAANILGITVVGALVPSVINAKFKFEWQNGEVVFKLQEIADKIMPALAPVALVAFTYWLLGRKRMTSTKAIFILMGLGIVLHVCQILA
ncbi:PTS system mannose/fructose/sorbose family transporter subunit IID [Clostridium gasigenes]|uniref:PTS system mannose/fructose/sorbose family transporter subunit IID n=1 Tax=Clostridium gasigenes TaxID=94869 RepID=A0A7X0VRD6_9CLOT|nr:PTS system mannose/fructose/sorbose family transporter subunit IID [Clostridium gasigenes]MBB6714495.1 PTS system mannose/fructose/sorbose family transporter subunit IID [Clostridium gasigenes]